jgi:hydrogenase maturation factor
VNPVVGRLEAVRDGPDGRWGTVDVRGARIEVALEAVPEARVGDSLLLEAGVALARLLEEGGVPCA